VVFKDFLEPISMQTMSPMSTPLRWSEGLELDFLAMDATHREFVDLLAAVVQAPDAQLLPAWTALIAHTDAHFSQEDQWMLATGFSPENCHSLQHKVILQVMREGQQSAQKGQLYVVRQMAYELGQWFPQHAQSMDASLALHLRSAGFDPIAGTVAEAAAIPTTPIHGCGGSTCGDTAAH